MEAARRGGVVVSMDSYGLCECGCGGKAPIADSSCKSRGYVRGEPKRFIAGHQTRGVRNNRWAGGRSRHNAGYSKVRAPEHPRAHRPTGYVYEHILVAEKAFGGHLPEGAEVHHVNGIRDDNRPSNLVVCHNRTYHMLLHRRQRALEACGDPAARYCCLCRSWDKPENVRLSQKRQQEVAHHPECARRYRRTMEARRRAVIPADTVRE